MSRVASGLRSVGVPKCSRVFASFADDVLLIVLSRVQPALLADWLGVREYRRPSPFGKSWPIESVRRSGHRARVGRVTPRAGTVRTGAVLPRRAFCGTWPSRLRPRSSFELAAPAPCDPS